MKNTRDKIHGNTILESSRKKAFSRNITNLSALYMKLLANLKNCVFKKNPNFSLKNPTSVRFSEIPLFQSHSTTTFLHCAHKKFSNTENRAIGKSM